MLSTLIFFCLSAWGSSGVCRRGE